MEEMFNECNSIKEIKFNENSNYKLDSLKSIDVSNFVLYKLKNNISNLFGDLEQNTYLKEIYNKLTRIKKEENIIKDIDSNIVMEIKITPTHFSYDGILLGIDFNDTQFSQ